MTTQSDRFVVNWLSAQLSLLTAICYEFMRMESKNVLNISGVYVDRTAL